MTSPELRMRFLYVVCFAVISWGDPLWACPVCFTPADPVITESLNAGILVLLGITAGVLAGFIRFILSLIRRASNTPAAGEPAA
jgi:hypothetical protein